MKVYVYKKADGTPYVLTEKQAYHENKQNKPLTRYGEKTFVGVADDTEYNRGAEKIKSEVYKRAREEARKQGLKGDALKEQTLELQIEILQEEYKPQMQQLLDDLVAQAEKNGKELPRDYSIMEIGSGGSGLGLASDKVRSHIRR